MIPIVAVVVPTPKKPKRNTHANIAISITFLMPKRRRKKAVIRMHNASEICEIETNIVGFEANQSLEMLPKLLI
jgi:hypothetical protein